MGNPLFAKKPMSMLLAEAHEEGGHSLKRTLGPFQLTALGVGAVIGAGIFVLSGLGAHYAGPGLMLSFVISGMGCAFAALCYAEFAAMIPLAGSAYTYAYATLGELFAWIIGWDLTLEYAMGASTVSSGWSNHFIEFLDIFHIKMPLWLAYDHWTAMETAEKMVARQMAQTADASLVPGTQAFMEKVALILKDHSPDLLQRAHDLVNAPTIFGMEIGFNLPELKRARGLTRRSWSSKWPWSCSSSGWDSNTFILRTGVRIGIALHPWGLAESGLELLTFSLPTSGLTQFRLLRRKPRILSEICHWALLLPC